MGRIPIKGGAVVTMERRIPDLPAGDVPAVNLVGSIDHAKIAAYIHATKFSTIVGDVKFADDGEWEKGRALFVPYQNVKGSDINQFQAGTQVILYPPELKSGKLIYPYAEAKR